MTDSIFISVVSYCDDLLRQTLTDALLKAKNPKRLFFGIVEQHFPEQRFLKGGSPTDNIRYIGVNPEDSRGCYWARNVVLSLYKGEKWFFQIDSHMLFDQDWDEKMVEAGKKCAEINPKFILGSYPKAFTMKDSKPVIAYNTTKTYVHVVPEGQEFNEHNYNLHLHGVEMHTDGIVKAFHHAGGCAFASGSIVNELPADPLFYFEGAEQAFALRAFTHGYDLFHMPDQPIYHMYDRSYRQTCWQELENLKKPESWEVSERRANQRFADLVAGKDLGVYGLGKVRTIQEYQEFSGIDYLNKKIHQKARKPEHIKLINVAPGPNLGDYPANLEINNQKINVITKIKNPNVVVFSNFLTDEECELMINGVKDKIKRSKTIDDTTGKSSEHEARTSSGSYYACGENDYIKKIEDRISKLVNWPMEKSEGIQVLKYGIGDQYKPHYDYFNETIKLDHGGQRIGTFLMYLNTPDKGGCTSFPDAGIEIAAQKGNAIFFSYDKPDSSTKTLHAGMPVIEGEKWIATKWLRQHKY